MLQNRGHVQSDLNWQALHNAGDSANNIVKCPVGSEADRSRHEKPIRSAVGTIDDGYAASMLRSIGAIARRQSIRPDVRNGSHNENSPDQPPKGNGSARQQMAKNG
jgi:hypothetical protein